MTCIAGVVKNGKVWIGADTGAVGTEEISPMPDTAKVYKKKTFLYAFAGSYRTGQIVQYLFTEPPRKASMSAEQYLVGPYIAELRKLMIGLGNTKDDEGAQEMRANILLGYDGRLYELQPDFAVLKLPEDGYAASGSGMHFALGALHAMKTKPPALRVRLALEASAHHCPNVRGPFHVLSL